MPRQPKFKKKIIIGITGSFGSGKTTVARIFAGRGAKIVDADKIAHRIIRPGEPTYKRIVKAFGKGILKKNKSIDRRKLARLVFGNESLRRKLNQITHPKILRIIKNKIRKAKTKLVVLDAPLLLEAGLRGGVDKLIVVKINRKKQIERLQHKASLTRQEILKRLKAQLPLKDKAASADFVIDNSGKLRKTRKQVKTVWRSLATDRK